MDSAGNIGYGSATLVIDDTPPTVSNLTITAGQPYTYLSEVQAAVPGVASTVYYGVATPIAATCTGNLDYPATQEQAYTVRLTAWDHVANRAVQEQTVTVSSVTKYYYHGSRWVAVRKGGQVYCQAWNKMSPNQRLKSGLFITQTG